jgi:hypothetical protein
VDYPSTSYIKMEPDDSSLGLWQLKTSAMFEDKRIHCSSSQPVSFTSISNRFLQNKCEKRVFTSPSLSICFFDCSPFSPSAQKKSAHNGRNFYTEIWWEKKSWKSDDIKSLHEQLSKIRSLIMIRLSNWKGLYSLWGTSKAQKVRQCSLRGTECKKEIQTLQKSIIDCELRASMLNINGLQISQFMDYTYPSLWTTDIPL